jgi:hypothetical protein
MKQRVLQILSERGVISEFAYRGKTALGALAAKRAGHKRAERYKVFKDKTDPQPTELHVKKFEPNRGKDNFRKRHRARWLRNYRNAVNGVPERKVKRKSFIKKQFGL